MAHGKLHGAMPRRYKDPDDCKFPVTVNMTEAQREIFKQAVKLSGLHQGEFVVKLAREFIILWELRGAEKNFEK